VTDDYGAHSLTFLEGLEAVRRRPGMYIGSTDTAGKTHCVYEIFDNSVDEALAGHCTTIKVTLHADGSVEVVDNGRGIPVDIEPKSGLTGVELVFTKLHAGGKFGGGGYAVSGGLHGVGASVVNALSTRLDVAVTRGGKVHTLSFRQGDPGHYDKDGTFTPGRSLKVTKADAGAENGTAVRYWPDHEIFLPTAVIDVAAVEARLRQTAFLVPGLRIEFVDLTGDEPRQETFHYEGGLADFVEHRAKDRPLTGVLHFTGEGSFTERVPVTRDGTQVMDDVKRTVTIDIAARWGVGYDTDVASFVNIVQTPKGGTHVGGFERALVRTINEQLKAQKVARAKDEPVIKEDILEGLTAVVTVRLAEPQFKGQTKEELGNGEVTALVAKVVATQLKEYLTAKATKGEGRRMLEKVQAAARTRLAARETKEAKRRKTALESASMPAKLVDCRSDDVELAELYIVEGDSALGTFKKGRDSEFQAALPIRGKILNTMRATERQMLANAECAAIIQVLGAGSGRSFDITQLRYGKLIALADADVDGAHIRCLLLTLCWRYLRPMLEAGMVYSAVPPLYRIEVSSPKKEFIYCYDDAERDKQLAKLAKKGAKVRAIQRFKGLGEMDEEQLRETTLSPENRRLRRMTVKDAEAAAAAFELCMGDQVPPRRDFIVEEGGLLDEHLIDA